MPDYKQMLKEAEEREANVKKVFQQYDLDGGGSIDPGEITCVMEDLGLLNGLKTDVTAFVAAAFARAAMGCCSRRQTAGARRGCEKRLC